MNGLPFKVFLGVLEFPFGNSSNREVGNTRRGRSIGMPKYQNPPFGVIGKSG
jgi:hypothetical protein